MVAGPRSASVSGAEPEPTPELEVLLRHQPFALGRHRLGQVPQQELLAYSRGGKPHARFYGGIQIGKLRPQSSLPDVVLHRTSPLR